MKLKARLALVLGQESVDGKPMESGDAGSSDSKSDDAR